MKIEYKALIPITFKDKENNSYTFEKVFFVVKNLAHPVFLGYEIIDNVIAKGIFHDHLSLINPKNNTTVDIPIVRQMKEPQINFLCSNDTYLLPYQTSFIKVKPETDILVNKPFILDTFGTDDNETWEILPCIQELSTTQEYFVGIRNLSDQPIGFSEAHTIAKTDLNFDKSSEIKAYSITVSPNQSDWFMDPNPISINNDKFSEIHVCNVKPSEPSEVEQKVDPHGFNETWKEIQDLPGLTNGEKDLLFNQYKKKGFYQIPCTYLYEDSKNYCEFPIEENILKGNEIWRHIPH